MKHKVFAAMKPKVASLGFTTEELEGVSASLAGNLSEDATEEQINSAIDNALPLLKLSQSAVNRIVNASKKKATPEEKKEEEKKPEQPKDEEAPEWAKALMKDISDLKTEKVATVRTSKFQEVIKDLPEKQREFMNLGFNPASFKSEEEFEAHILKIQELVPSIAQEYSNEELGKQGQPGAGGSARTEAEAFAKRMAEINKKTE